LSRRSAFIVPFDFVSLDPLIGRKPRATRWWALVELRLAVGRSRCCSRPVIDRLNQRLAFRRFSVAKAQGAGARGSSSTSRNDVVLNHGVRACSDVRRQSDHAAVRLIVHLEFDPRPPVRRALISLITAIKPGSPRFPARVSSGCCATPREAMAPARFYG